MHTLASALLLMAFSNAPQTLHEGAICSGSLRGPNAGSLVCSPPCYRECELDAEGQMYCSCVYIF